MVTPTYAYTLNENGDLVSQNVAIEYNNVGWSCSIKFNAQANTTYSLKAVGTSSINEQVYIQSNGSIIQQVYAPNSYSSSIVDGFHFTTSNNVNGDVELVCRFNVYVTTLNNVMLNVGNEFLSFEPYGIWYNSDQFEISNYGPLYKVLNGTTAKLYDFNSNQLSDLLNANPIISETIEWNNNYDFKNTMIPNIRNAILNGADELYNVDRPMVLLSLKTPLLIDNLSFYRMVSNEIRYIYLYFEDGSMESISIANASDVSTKYSIWYNQNKKSLLYIAFDNEVNFDMVSTISQPAYNMVYSDAYNTGSYDGYKEGYNDGLKQSAPNSYIEGYNKGYNDGIQEDLESSGFRTLITTILSYPVNMVRESLNFEFMGIHVASIVLFVVSLGIVAFVIKRFKD